MPPTMTAAIKPAAAVECGSFAKAPDAKTYAALLKGPPMSMDIMPARIAEQDGIARAEVIREVRDQTLIVEKIGLTMKYMISAMNSKPKIG